MREGGELKKEKGKKGFVILGHKGGTKGKKKKKRE